jgi:hypothetical protein
VTDRINQEVLSLFGGISADGLSIAEEIQRRVEFTFPPECISGVTLNARLLQSHYDTLVGVQDD